MTARQLHRVESLWQDNENPLLFPEWQEHALCRQMDPQLFFNEPGEPTSTAEARRACQMCPVRELCLEWTLSFSDDDDLFGIFGGVGPKARKKLRAELNTQEVAA
jgi:WhiB family redox-sensing transcriptional regulator